MANQEGSKRPGESAFKQQKMKAWQPILTPRNVIPTFLIIGVIFLVIGIVLKTSSDSVIQYTKEYSNIDECKLAEGETVKNCSVSVTTTKDMKAPVYLYYKLTNFYQNHRRYVSSRSDAQLSGDTITTYGGLEECDPLRSLGGSKDVADLLNPCGLIAYSLFNDTITLSGPSGEVALRKDGIAWDSDMKEKYKSNPESAGVIPPTWPPEVTSVEDEDVAVWMRVAGLPTFKKLYRIIDQDLPAGTYTFDVTSRFDVDSFDGTKSLVLSTTEWIGGKNDFLGIMYILVGVVSLVLGVTFLALNMIKPRKLADPKFLAWSSQ